MRFQRVAWNFDPRLHRRDPIIDNQSDWHAPQPHADHFAHAYRRIRDACPKPYAEEVEQDDTKNECKNRKDRDSDEIERVHSAGRLLQNFEVGDNVSLQLRRDGIRIRVVTTTNAKVAVVGASGYAGEELVRLLLSHPDVDLTAVTSRQFAGRTLAEVFPRFSHHEKADRLKFADADPKQLARKAQIVFLALPHGLAAEFAKPLLVAGARVVDLSADFRVKDAAVYQEFYGKDHPAPELLGQAVYGLPEIYRDQIREAKLVACPGCYPTSVLIPLRPLIRRKAIDRTKILVASLSGVSGAGRKIEADYLFAECNESVRPYGVPKHRHLSEIEQELSILAGEKVVIQFTPHLVPVNRGIITTIYADPGGSVVDLDPALLFSGAYGEEPFVRLLGDERLPDTKNVVGTNFIDIAWKIDKRTGRLIVMSAIDNIVKGASGQAIQCFNLMRGLSETAGLI
jgi:N-acetyl-gamma-glutamyl-phosphate reductase